MFTVGVSAWRECGDSSRVPGVTIGRQTCQRTVGELLAEQLAAETNTTHARTRERAPLSGTARRCRRARVQRAALSYGSFGFKLDVTTSLLFAYTAINFIIPHFPVIPRTVREVCSFESCDTI